ncbi:MAG TPA: fructose-bisphosphatase class III [Clostridiales bacterium]|nr:fructose-bisphosphatase class III [Clostridiales bacterium]
MKYVISDIHGCYDKFMKMLEVINFQPEDQMYILGDVIDRGKESIKLLQYIMKQFNMELLLGNHEEMALQWLKNNDSGYFSCWMNNGGQSTYSQYCELNDIERVTIIEYLNHRPLFLTIDKYILVHAGVDFKTKGNQSRETLLWTRDEFINSVDRFKDNVVIFGHTPTYYMQPNIKPMKIWKEHDGKIGIDCGVVFNGGQLGCLRLDDMAEFYV